MPSFFNLTLDTLAPQNVTLAINGGALYTNTTTVDLTIGTSDTPTTGYQMKIWGIAGVANEVAATWETYSATKQVTLTSGDGSKTVTVRLRDDVLNESATASASITLDTAVPVVTIVGGPDVSRISLMTGANEANFSFEVDKPFVEYMVRVVPTSGSLHTQGTLIPTTGGSTNMADTGSFPEDTAIACMIRGADLQTASSAEGLKIIKVFAKDVSGNWSTT